MSDHIQVTRDGAVQILRLNRADKKNSLTSAMYVALIKAFEEANSDESVGAILVLGQPGVFSAGNDLADFLAAGEGDGPSQAFNFVGALADNDKSLIAAVDGVAVGIGTTLMFHCDMVFASPLAHFMTPFVNLGLIPEAGSSLLAPRLMGTARAFELIVMGEPFSAERAREAGFVNHVVPSEELEAAALKAAHAIAKKPREALRITRRLLRGDKADIKARMEEEGALFADRLNSDEAKAAFQAFLTKAPKAT